ncbi:hypothetical protein H696_02282 [Fonticula alba]|uniref:Uncharacterized protein n=1 Tax=Fonticula alba TaxID=691883 RepID=A0A058ZD21_FONAL|nr:hypothetical protein H696_02282 [Fonticula alba]KCV71337.1 hypothetical protein H696_02282 [Fonticula alba]|eukprot:XP_009494460.1 hypothetical protein H696_02282 [Fonticula alba]
MAPSPDSGGPPQDAILRILNAANDFDGGHSETPAESVEIKRDPIRPAMKPRVLTRNDPWDRDELSQLLLIIQALGLSAEQLTPMIIHERAPADCLQAICSIEIKELLAEALASQTSLDRWADTTPVPPGAGWQPGRPRVRRRYLSLGRDMAADGVCTENADIRGADVWARQCLATSEQGEDVQLDLAGIYGCLAFELAGGHRGN